MSTTTTANAQPVSLKLAQAASVFLIGYDDTTGGEGEPSGSGSTNAADLAAQEEEARKRAKSTRFILNTKDFVQLQRYLFAGGALPPTEKQFETEHPLNSFGNFFETQPTLYGKLKIVLPRINQRTTGFRTEGLLPMLTLGSQIASYADYARRSLTLIKNLVIEMLKFPYNSPEYKSHKASIEKRFVELKTEAEKNEKACQQTAVRLSDFGSVTLNDEVDVVEIQNMLKGCNLEDEDQELKAFRLNVEIFIKHFKTAIVDDAVGESRRKTFISVYAFGPIIILAQLYEEEQARNRLKFIQDLERNLNEAVENRKLHAQLVHRSVDNLLTEVKSIGETIQGAIKSVDKTKRTFIELQTCYSDILRDLTGASSDTEVERVVISVVNDELDSVIIRWAQVSEYARVFCENGMILDESDTLAES